jgi:hypothetical protein
MRWKDRQGTSSEGEILAERRKPNEKPDLTPDALAPAAGDQPPPSVPIYGILGESPVASSVRLFLDVGLTTYYDIPIEGIVKREKVPADQSPLGVDSSLLFVLKGIKLVVHTTDTRTVEEEFLSGDFTAPGSFTPDPGGGPQAPPGIPQPASQLCATNIGCPTQIIQLCRPSLGIACTVFPPCGIRSANPCPTVQPCHTHIPVCLVSRNPCPSVFPCITHAHWCRPPLSHTPCASVFPCITHAQWCPPPVSHTPCPTVQLCPHTQPPLCPILSATPCPTVGACPTIACGPGGGGGDPIG